MPAILMQHDEDPAKVITKSVGDLKDIIIFGNFVLVGIYERPEKTKGGLILTDRTRAEEKSQGKAAMILKKGPFAFVSDLNYDFRGQNVAIGDWVAIFVSDGRSITINGWVCRLVEDQYIRLKIPAPDVVY